MFILDNEKKKKNTKKGSWSNAVLATLAAVIDRYTAVCSLFPASEFL